jgi:hypothetical protein
MQIKNANFLEYQDQLNIRKKEGKTYIYDPVRKKDLVLQPEELVRQLIIQYLIQALNYPLNKIAVEFGLKVNTLLKRCDILVYNQDYKEALMVECKAPQVKLTQAVFKQIATYNMSMQVPYLLVSNGPTTYCAKIDFEQEKFTFLDEIPSFESLIF